jgi:hypothetical protein
VRVKAVSGVTLNVAEQVLVAWHVVPSVRVQITVVVPPQAEGAPLPAVSAESIALQPPPELTPANQAAN